MSSIDPENSEKMGCPKGNARLRSKHCSQNAAQMTLEGGGLINSESSELDVTIFGGPIERPQDP